MSILVFIDHFEGKIKKTSLEAASYASKLASNDNTAVNAVVLGSISDDSINSLGQFGIQKVLHATDDRFNVFDSKSYCKAIAEAGDKTDASIYILSFNQNGKALGPRLSARLKAGYVPGALEVPSTDGGFIVKKSVFSGKGIAHYEITSASRVIAVNPNSIPISKTDGTATIEAFSPAMEDADFTIKQRSIEKLSGKISLSEAELVVSAGRGLRGPENWKMIEELADEMGAATACSRAVSDVHWRSHHEHVGQTGLTIRPNLYIAVAISGAIQHLAGVNGSKNIVVINNDPEAPFFKAADYGIVGDAFEVVPKLIEAYKSYKNSVH